MRPPPSLIRAARRRPCVRGTPSRRGLLAAGVVLLVLAVALGVLAFTRFEGGEVPMVGSPAFAEYERERVWDARASVVFGLAGAFALVGGLAFLDRARRPSSLPERKPQP